MNMIMNFLKDEEGAVLAEYGLLLALIAVLLIAAIGFFKDAIIGAFDAATTAMGGDTE